MSHAACLVYAKPDHNLKLSETSPTRRARVAITRRALPTAQRDAQHVPRVLGILAHERSFATGSRSVRGRHAAVDPRHYARQAQGVRRWQGGGGVHRA